MIDQFIVQATIWAISRYTCNLQSPLANLEIINKLVFLFLKKQNLTCKQQESGERPSVVQTEADRCPNCACCRIQSYQRGLPQHTSLETPLL